MRQKRFISMCLLFCLSFNAFGALTEERRLRFESFLDGLRNIPVNDHLVEEKNAKLSELKTRINEVKDDSEWNSVYTLFISVRNWLLEHAIDKPSLSEERIEELSNGWIISNSLLCVRLNRGNWSMIVNRGNCNWEFQESDSNDIILTDRRFALGSAQIVQSEPLITGYGKGYTFRFSNFPDLPELVVNVSLILSNNCLSIDITATDADKKLLELQYPKSIKMNQNKEEYSVLPLMQGSIFPSDYGKAFYSKELCNSRTMYMPWWGHVRGSNGVLAVLASTEDAGVEYQHPAGGPTRVQPVWYASMGELRYLRRIEYYFLTEADYVRLAKRFRQWAKERGYFVSLREKIARCPILEKLIGIPVIHVGALYHNVEQSHYFVKDPIEQSHQMQTYDQISEALRTLKNRGLESAYVHLDGWGFYGYDSGHPDTVPVGYEVGGLEGLKRLSHTCKELNYLLALHDNYRDYYKNAVSSNDKLALMDRNGNIPQHSIWCGGPQTILSPRYILPYMMKNYEWLIAKGVEIQGVYVDVFSVVPLEESYQPHCPVNRHECAEYRYEGFRYLKSKGYIVSSEEPTYYLLPYLDLVHHGPYYVRGSFERGEAIGIPVPLFNLVYHDALIIPWSTSEDGGWGIPIGDAGFLHCVLNAGIPYLDLKADEEKIKQTKEFCRLFAHCAHLEMIKHEFLDDTYRKQKSTFSDGTYVIVDFDNKTYEIHYSDVVSQPTNL